MRRLVNPQVFGHVSIGLARFGCTNRPFYHVCVFPDRALGRRCEDSIIEQVGTFDPLPNSRNEKLVALNYDRLKYWIGTRSAHISVPALEILGLAGFLPLHPKTFIRARDAREAAAAREAVAVDAEVAEVEEGESKQQLSALNGTGVSKESGAFRLFSETKACASELSQLAEGDGYESWPPCSPSVVSVDIGAHAVIPKGINVIPYADTNISVLVHSSEVHAVFIRLHCLYAPDGEDSYCHGHQSQIKSWGRMIYPCRGFQLMKPANEANIQLPFLYAYDCFRLFAKSQYLVNVTVLPHKCLASVVFTAPDHTQFFPEVADYYDFRPSSLKQHPRVHTWSALLLVDLTSSADGVWLRFTLPSGVHWNKITLALYLVDEDGQRQLRLLHSFIVETPDTGVKWKNAARGSYSLYGFVSRYDCELWCEERRQGSGEDSACRACPHTHLNFTLSHHYATLQQRMLWVSRDVGPVVAGTLLGIAMVSGLLGILYMHWQTRRAAKRIEDIALTETPEVLLIYSDDFDEHSKAVFEFGEVLRFAANARILIDSDQLLKPGRRQLRQRRPFPDQFMLAFNIIVKELAAEMALSHAAVQSSSPSSESALVNHEPSSSPDMQNLSTPRMSAMFSRVCFVRLPYSPPTPSQIAMLGVSCFSIPTELLQLVAFLHGVRATENASMPSLTPSSLASLEEVIKDSSTIHAALPHDWPFQRTEDIICPSELARHQLQQVKSVITKEEALERRNGEEGLSKEKLAEMGLLPPDEDDGNEENMLDSVAETALLQKGKFELLPPDSDSD